jgi:hypothetical protein
VVPPWFRCRFRCILQIVKGIPLVPLFRNPLLTSRFRRESAPVDKRNHSRSYSIDSQGRVRPATANADPRISWFPSVWIDSRTRGSKRAALKESQQTPDVAYEAGAAPCSRCHKTSQTVAPQPPGKRLPCVLKCRQVFRVKTAESLGIGQMVCDVEKPEYAGFEDRDAGSRQSAFAFWVPRTYIACKESERGVRPALSPNLFLSMCAK